MNDKHILLVEDDQTLQALIEKLLVNNDYVVSKAVNIEDGAITGGVDNTGNSATPSGPIALSTIVGANIADSTVTKNKLEQMNNYKVLGSVTNDGQADNDNPNNPVTEVNVLQNIIPELAANDKQNNLATVQAIKTLFASASGAQPIAEATLETLYIGNTSAQDFTLYPQRLELVDSTSSTNVNIDLIARSRHNNGFRTNFRPNLATKPRSSSEGQERYPRSRYQPTPPNTDTSNQNYNGYVLERSSSYIGNNLWMSNLSELRLPSADYWYNTYGPNVPITINLTLKADDSLNVPDNTIISTASRHDKKYYALKILPNSSDVNAKSAWEGEVTNISQITIKEGVPTYVIHSDNTDRPGKDLFYDNTPNPLPIMVRGGEKKAMPYENINMGFLVLRTNGESITKKIYVRKYSRSFQIFGKWQSVSALPRDTFEFGESYVWHITD